MDHENVRGLMSDYLEGSLAPDQKKTIEDHVAGCDSCRQDLALLQRTLKLVRALPKVEAPPHFISAVRRRARKAGLFDTRRGARWARIMVPYEATLVVLLATVGALIVLQLLPLSVRPVAVEQQPLLLLVEGGEQINAVARATWEAQGEVKILGKAVPPGSPLGVPSDMELAIPWEGWPALLSSLDRIGIGGALPKQPAAAQDNRIHVLVQIRSRPAPGMDGGAGSGGNTP